MTIHLVWMPVFVFQCSCSQAHQCSTQQFNLVRLSLSCLRLKLKRLIQIPDSSRRRKPKPGTMSRQIPSGFIYHTGTNVIFKSLLFLNEPLQLSFIQSSSPYTSFPFFAHLSYPWVPNVICAEELRAIQYWNLWKIIMNES